MMRVPAAVANVTGGTKDRCIEVLRVGGSRGTEENFGGKRTERELREEKRRKQNQNIEEEVTPRSSHKDAELHDRTVMLLLLLLQAPTVAATESSSSCNRTSISELPGVITMYLKVQND
jgi:hypothetical protein